MADTTNRLAGVAYLSVDGQNYMLSGDLSYSAASTSRETLGGQDVIHGYSEKPKAPFISGTLRDAGSLTLQSFNDMTNVTITLARSSGLPPGVNTSTCRSVIGTAPLTVGTRDAAAPHTATAIARK